MIYAFTAKGHPNITASHKATLEITKDRELTKQGDCIIAVCADFSLAEIRKVIGNSGKIKLTIEAAGMKDEITAAANKEFCNEHEIVLRKGSFTSERTLGIHADKAAAGLKRELMERLKGTETAVSLTLESC